MKKAIRNFLWLSLVLVMPQVATAQDESDEIKIIPYSQLDRYSAPCLQYCTGDSKGIIRNAECGSYRVWWDTNFNDNFNDDPSRDVSRNDNGRTVYDIGRNFVIPNTNADSKLNVNVRVRNLCNNNDKFGTMKFFVYAFSPITTPTIGRTSSLRSSHKSRCKRRCGTPTAQRVP